MKSAFAALQKRTESDRIIVVGMDMRMIPKKETIIIEFKSDIDCLDEKELVSEIVGMTNTEGVISREQRRRWR